VRGAIRNDRPYRDLVEGLDGTRQNGLAIALRELERLGGEHINLTGNYQWKGTKPQTRHTNVQRHSFYV
jgi:hypothetical protein